MNAAALYDRLAGLYDILFSSVLDQGRADVVRQINTLPPSRVLEIGVGTGLSLNGYDRKHRITGIDISQKMIDKAKSRQAKLGLDHVDLRQMNAECLAFADHSFDVVIALYVVSTVNDPKKVMAEMERVCQPQGKIFVVNHFSHALSGLEKAVLPLTSRIGWRSYFKQDEIDTPSLRLANSRRTNLFGYWQVLEFERR